MPDPNKDIQDESLETKAGDTSDTGEEKDEDKKGGDADGGEVDNDSSNEDIKDPGEDFIPPTRKNALPFILHRKEKKIEKLEKEISDDDGGSIDSGEGDGESLSPAAQRAVDRAVREALAPAANRIAEVAGESEFREFLARSENAGYRKYEKVARRYAANPAYANVALDFLFAGLSTKEAEMRGARNATEHKEKVRKNTIGAGGGSREIKSDNDIVSGLKFTDKEFKALDQKIGSGKTIKFEPTE